MSFREKSNLVILLSTLFTLGLHAAHALESGPRIAAFSTVLGATISFVVLAIIGHIMIAITGGRDADRSDERDLLVDRRTDRISEAALTAVVLGILAYGLAQDDVLLANIAFFGLFGATLVKALAKAVLYRMAA
ncbi:hypothetical protein [Parvularcula lutaonensis]|uniref:Uncharacterized protein n=1 Tax=Parvularcula lutaonensis TaxID=491923 RepID=A0ABV7MAG2_9PROT|nr:hypothetical protein [Parvularcula lutaonensis]GGY46939.1 hypothetical protein GCM10007148_15180 [Parvularcula lutaonensis]